MTEWHQVWPIEVAMRVYQQFSCDQHCTTSCTLWSSMHFKVSKHATLACKGIKGNL